MQGFLADLRHGLRSFRRDAGFTALAVLALAIGVGSSTAMFSVVDTVLVRPLPYSAPERLLLLTALDRAGERVPMGPAEYLHLAQNAKTIEAIGVFSPGSATVAAASGAAQVRAANLSASLFATLGIAPARGRAFEPAEDFAGSESVAVVSNAFWRRELGADPAAIGRTIEVDHKPVTVIGVLAPDVAFPGLARSEVFLPLAITPKQAALRIDRTGLYGLARMNPGVTAGEAKAEMDTLMRAFNGYGIAVQPLLGWLTDDAAPALRVAFAAVLLLLLIACANVALLLVMRGTARGRDLAIRAALGGGRRRLALQQVTEAIVLALAGGALGLILALFAIRAVVDLAPRLPRLNELHVGLSTAAFALGASLVSGALAGLASAAQAMRPDLFLLLKDGGGGATAGATRSRMRDGLVIAQLAIALLLATATGLLVRSMQRFSAVPLGVEPRNMSATFVYAQGAGLDAATARLLETARTIPGVEHAALVGVLPFEVGRGWSDTLHIEGRHPTSTAWDVTSVNWFTPGYLATAGTRLLAGRDFSAADGATSAPVVLVNQTFVDKYLSGKDPIGALIGLTDWLPTSFTVVGVIQDVRQYGPGEPLFPEVYLPQLQFARNRQEYEQGAMLVVRSRLPAARLGSALRAVTAGLGANVLLGTTKPVDGYLSGFFLQRQFQLDLALAFAVAALALAALGVYGAMAFSVVQRRRELAIRAALGAQGRQLFGLVLGRGIRLALVGTCLGVLGSLVLSRFLAALLFGVGERDPLTYAIAVATLAIAAVAATVLPALTAARLDPMTLLRSE